MTEEQLRTAVADLDPPFGVIDRAALHANARDLVRRAAGKPIRVASKSVRVRAALTEVLALPGFAGVLSYALTEALWLHGNGFTDIVVGYPSAHRAAFGRLCADPEAAAAITVMIDDPAQLDLIDQVCSPARRPPVRVCLELDAGYRRGLVRAGALRSPVRTPDGLAGLAAQVAGRAGFRLVGIMAYEGQIAGVGDAGRTARAVAVRAMQQASAAELAERRAAAVAAVSEIADLEFVNGGGTGSLHLTGHEAAVTEVAAGSGLFAPGLFDHYTAFHPEPAAYFVLPVVRKPSRSVATVLGGGWIASGPPGADRLPTIAHPAGLGYVGAEGAGEVQTPLRGRAARKLQVGDQVWFRHAKAGELAEHLDEFVVVESGRVMRNWPTYRGEGKVF